MKQREKSGSYTVAQRLLPNHYAIQDLYLAGLKAEEIATRVNLTSRQVRNILNTPQFQHELALRRSKIEQSVDQTLVQAHEDVASIIRDQTIQAARKLGELIDSQNESVARQAANDILDRGGYPKVTKSDVSQQQSVVVDADQARVIAETLQQIQGESCHNGSAVHVGTHGSPLPIPEEKEKCPVEQKNVETTEKNEQDAGKNSGEGGSLP